jgi:hypothetical protein
MTNRKKNILVDLPQPLAKDIATLALKNKRSTRREIELAVENHVASSVRDTHPILRQKSRMRVK